MMPSLSAPITDLLNWIWLHILTPVALAVGKGLEVIILRPLSEAGLSPFGQVLVVGMLVGLLSMIIKRLLKTQEKEEAFRKLFEKKKEVEEGIRQIDDWKIKKVLYETSDEDIDEEYNKFISIKFAHFGLTYLLPIFLTLYWLSCVFSPEKLTEITGSIFLLKLPQNPIHLPGLSVPLTFFIGYFSSYTIKKTITILSKKLKKSPIGDLKIARGDTK